MKREGNLKDFPEIQLASKYIDNISKIILETILVNNKELLTESELSKKLVEELLPKFLIDPNVLEFFHTVNGILREVTLTCQKQVNLFIDELNQTDQKEFHRYVSALHLICGLHDIYSEVSKKICSCLKTQDLVEYETLSLAVRLFCMRTQDSIMSILTNQMLEDPSHEDSVKANTH